MSISAMKQALEALETDPCKENAINNAQFFIKQAIAEAEKQEPVANEQAVIDKFLGNSFPMLSAITEQPKQEPVAKYSDIVSDGGLDPRNVHASDISQECVDETAKDRHEWVEQPDLARVGEVGVWGDKREWVELTHIEIGNLWADSQEVYSFAKAIEVKLKEKNT